MGSCFYAVRVSVVVVVVVETGATLLALLFMFPFAVRGMVDDFFKFLMCLMMFGGFDLA